jgi:hypothetical protein
MGTVKSWNEYLREGLNRQRGINEDTWILYYYNNYIPYFISVHGSEKEAEAAWYNAVKLQFGDEIQEWMEGNLPAGVESLDDLSQAEFDRLHREGVMWASDDLAHEVEITYETLGDLKERDMYYSPDWKKFRESIESSVPSSGRHRRHRRP